MIELKHMRDLDIAAADGRPGFVSAASGLARVGGWWHVVADDSLTLASFPADGDAAGALLQMLDGALPAEAGERKARKPDFEALTVLERSETWPFGALLAFGSGSRPNRERGALVALDGNGRATRACPVDLGAIYAGLAGHFAEVNIEGAVAIGDTLVLLQRGNAGGAPSAIVSLALEAALRSFETTRPLRPSSVRAVDVGRIGAVPLAFTDAARLGDEIVFSAVAEDTSNAYDDGALAGATVGIMDVHGHIREVEAVSPAVKIEGIHAARDGNRVRLTMVTDADDPNRPAALFTASVDW